MKQSLILARKEIRDGLRNKWVLAVSILLALLALSLGLLGSVPTGSVKVDPLTVTVVSLSSLSIFLIPLIALLLSFDAIVGEIERGTMSLILSYPVKRWQLMVGKFTGHVSILAIATVCGYGIAGIALQIIYGDLDFSAWQPFLMLIVAIYVQDMGQADGLGNPPSDSWINAIKAFYVINSNAIGGMGAPDALPFAKRADAEKFIDSNGGILVEFNNMPEDYILRGASSDSLDLIPGG